MRSVILAVVLLALTTAAPLAADRGAHAMTLPASFVGVLPCADCPGIRHHLDVKWTPKSGHGFKFNVGPISKGPMMPKQKRTTHSPELKAKVALEAVRGLKTATEIAQEYGVHPVQVSQ